MCSGSSARSKQRRGLHYPALQPAIAAAATATSHGITAHEASVLTLLFGVGGLFAVALVDLCGARIALDPPQPAQWAETIYFAAGAAVLSGAATYLAVDRSTIGGTWLTVMLLVIAPLILGAILDRTVVPMFVALLGSVAALAVMGLVIPELMPVVGLVGTVAIALATRPIYWRFAALLGSGAILLVAAAPVGRGRGFGSNRTRIHHRRGGRGRDRGSLPAPRPHGRTSPKERPPHGQAHEEHATGRAHDDEELRYLPVLAFGQALAYPVEQTAREGDVLRQQRQSGSQHHQPGPGENQQRDTDAAHDDPGGDARHSNQKMSLSLLNTFLATPRFELGLDRRLFELAELVAPAFVLGWGHPGPTYRRLGSRRPACVMVVPNGTQ